MGVWNHVRDLNEKLRSWLFFVTAVISAVAVTLILDSSLQISNSVRFESKEWRRFSQLFDQTLDELFLEYDTPDSALSELRERITALGLTRHHFRKEDNFYLFTNFQKNVIKIGSILAIWILLWFIISIFKSTDESNHRKIRNRLISEDTRTEQHFKLWGSRIGKDGASEKEFRAYHAVIEPLVNEFKQQFEIKYHPTNDQCDQRLLRLRFKQKKHKKLTVQSSKLIKQGMRGCNVISVINCSLKGNFISKTLVFLWNSQVWSSLVNILILIHILMSLVESEQMISLDRCIRSKDDHRWLHWCNLKKDNSNYDDDSHSSFVSMTVLKCVIIFIEIMDVLSRIIDFYYGIYPFLSQNKNDNHLKYIKAKVLSFLNFDTYDCCVLCGHLICVSFLSLDHIILETFYHITLQFILPLRMLLIILRNPAISHHCKSVFESLWIARAVLYLFGTVVCIGSLFSVILFQNNWGLKKTDIQAWLSLEMNEEEERRRQRRRRLLIVPTPTPSESTMMMSDHSRIQITSDVTSYILAKMGADQGLKSLQSGMFGEITRSMLTMFVSIISTDNVSIMMQNIWLNPLYSKTGVIFVSITTFIGLWIVTPIILSVFLAAWSARKRDMNEKHQRYLRSAIICSFIMIDSEDDNLINHDEFSQFTQDISEISDEQCLKLFDKLDVDHSGTLSLYQFVMGLETIFQSSIFKLPDPYSAELVNLKIYSHYYYRRWMKRIVNLFRILVLFIQSISLVILHLGSDMLTLEKKIKLDLIVFIGLMIYFIDVFILHICILFQCNLFAYFNPTLFVNRKHSGSAHWDQIAHTDEVIHRLDAVLCAFCVLTHAVVVLCSGISFGRWTLFPWHSENGHSQSSLLSDDSSLRFDWDLSSHHRIWMSISVARLLFVFGLPRILISTLIRAFRRMVPLFALIFTFLMLFANFAVVLFRSHSYYNGIHVFADMGSALTTFAQLQIGQSVSDLLYQSIEWDRSWFWALGFGVLYQTFLVVMIGNLFLSLLITESEQLFLDMYNFYQGGEDEHRAAHDPGNLAVPMQEDSDPISSTLSSSTTTTTTTSSDTAMMQMSEVNESNQEWRKMSNAEENKRLKHMLAKKIDFREDT